MWEDGNEEAEGGMPADQSRFYGPQIERDQVGLWNLQYSWRSVVYGRFSREDKTASQLRHALKRKGWCLYLKCASLVLSYISRNGRCQTLAE